MTITYDDTRDIAIRIISQLIEDGHVQESDDTYFEIQDIIQDAMNKVLGLDIDDNFSIQTK